LQVFRSARSDPDPHCRIRISAARWACRRHFASISNFISPESFPFFQSILFLLVVMVGGADRVLGRWSARHRRAAAERCRRSANTGCCSSEC